MNKEKLIELATKQFKLDINGYHGLDHWQRVEGNGLLVAESLPQARDNVITHFAYLHDACREDEGEDPGHGLRAAMWVENLWLYGGIDLDASDFALLYRAISDHAAGRTSNDPTIGACWDADRLDLWRVGITPAERFMSTKAGKELLMIEIAHDRKETQ